MIGSLIKRLRPKPKPEPRVVTCTIGTYDFFPRGLGCWELSLLAKDALKRAGIDRSKPHGYTLDAQKGLVTFTQVQDGEP